MQAGFGRAVIAAVCASLTACGGGGGSDNSGGGGGGGPTTFTIGGTLTGLEAVGLVLQNNGGDDLPLATNGAFTFTAPVATGAAYVVAIKTQPNLGPTQLCTVTNGAGTVASAAVSNVAVSCVPRFAKFLYVANEGSGTVTAYTIDAATGRLDPVAGSPFIAGTRPRFATAVPGNNHLYVTNVGSNAEPPTISGYSIDGATGALTELLTSPFDLSVTPVPPGAPSVTPPLVHPTGAFTYLSVPIPTGQLYGASIDAATGELTEIAGMPLTIGSGITAAAFDSAGRTLFVPTNASPGGPGEIATFFVNTPSGVLTPIGTFPTGGNNPGAAVVTPQDAFLLVPNTLSANIAVFAVDAVAGTLTTVGLPVATGPAGSQPIAPFLNRRTNFLYLTNSHTSQPWTLAALRFNPATGELTPLAGSPYATNGAAGFVVPHPSGRFLYQASATSIQRFAIDQTSGIPTLVADVTTPLETGPYRIAQDPSGRYMYVAAAGSTTVSAYSIDATTGALTPVNTQPTGHTPFPWWAGLQ